MDGLTGVVAALWGLLLAVVILMLGVAGRRPMPDEPVPDAVEMRKHYIFGVLYCNPDDPRGWVPKSIGYGWTVNFRHPGWARSFFWYSVVGLIVLLALTLMEPLPR